MSQQLFSSNHRQLGIALPIILAGANSRVMLRHVTYLTRVLSAYASISIDEVTVEAAFSYLTYLAAQYTSLIPAKDDGKNRSHILGIAPRGIGR
jgi:hypothetical protein